MNRIIGKADACFTGKQVPGADALEQVNSEWRFGNPSANTDNITLAEVMKYESS